MPYANKEGADQPAHPCRLISNFVVCCLDSLNPIHVLAINSKILRLKLVSEAEQASLSLYLVGLLKSVLPDD